MHLVFERLTNPSKVGQNTGGNTKRMHYSIMVAIADMTRNSPTYPKYVYVGSDILLSCLCRETFGRRDEMF